MGNNRKFMEMREGILQRMQREQAARAAVPKPKPVTCRIPGCGDTVTVVEYIRRDVIYYCDRHRPVPVVNIRTD